MDQELEKYPTFEELCLRFRGRLLKGRYAHTCWDWDELPVDESCPEWPCACAVEIVLDTLKDVTKDLERVLEQRSKGQ